MNKRMDLTGLDYKMVDGFIIINPSMLVYTQSGLCLGELPKGSFPQSGPEVLDKIKPIKKEDKLEEKQALSEKIKKGLKGAH